MNSPETGSESKQTAGAAALLIGGDLFFGSRITGTARDLGIVVDVAAQAEQVRERLREKTYQLIILDLEAPGLTAAQLVEMLPAENRPHLVAFGPHVRTRQLQAAREAGCDEVMPRSRFSAELADILRCALPAR